jgi:DNA mismatch repair ATPase MutS
LSDLQEMIARTLVEEPPVTLNDGGAVREAVDAELDELRGLSQNGRRMIAAIEERERERTGIGSLKVRFNSVFGYYIEVTKANSKAVPTDYERKQTLVNAERFTPRRSGQVRSSAEFSRNCGGSCWRMRRAYARQRGMWRRLICSQALLMWRPCTDGRGPR